MDCQDVYNLDNNTQLEFLHSKTVLVIDKSRFLVCKQLMMQNASDEEFASFLEIPAEKVRCFKYKMTLWENKLRARRRTAQLNSKKSHKRDNTSQDRFKKARELVARNLSVSEISKILKMSERSITRFKKKMREQKRKLKEEGKLHLDPNDEDNSFKYLTEAEKFRRAKDLFERGLRFNEISEICKVSERTVRRWKDRLSTMDFAEIGVETGDECQTDDDQKPKPQRQRRPFYDREKIEYAKELIENGLSNKEMSMLLELSIANVRKLKVNILKGTINELIDDSAEHYSNLKGNSDLDDPLEFDGMSIPVNYGSRRKPKINLTDREMHIVRLLRDRGVRTMNIAKMVGICERSVTRLLSKSREYTLHEYSVDIIEEVERLLKENVEIERLLEDKEALEETLEKEVSAVEEPGEIPQPSFSQNFISKSRIGTDLIRMNVKTSEIAKMLEVSEKQVNKWRKLVNLQVRNVEQEEELINEMEDDSSYMVIEEIDPKMEYVEEEYLEYQ